MFAEAMGSEALAARRRETLRGFAALVAAQGRAFYGIGDRADRLVQLSAMMLVGGLAEAFAAWLDGDVPATREQLIDECAELFVATGEAAVGLARLR